MATTYLGKLRLFSRDVRLYLVSQALVGFSYLGIYVVLFNLYLLRLGYGPEFIGLVNAALRLPMILFSLAAGGVAGRWGARRTMIAGMILIVAGLGLPPLGEFMPASLRAGWLVVTLSFAGIGAPLWIVNALPFLTGATSPEERSHAFSVQTALFPLAGFAGSLTAGLLPGLFASALGLSLHDPAPYRYPLFIAGLLLIPAVLALLATREIGGAETREAVAEASPAPWGLMALLALFTLLRMAGEWGPRTFFNLYLDASLHAPTSLIGGLVAVSQLLGGTAALGAPLLMGRWGRFRTVVWGSVGVALAALPLALIPHWTAAGLALVALVTMARMTYPAFTVYHQEIVSPGRRATMSGAVIMAEAVASSAIALGGGYTITALGYRSLFLMGASVAAAGGLLFWATFRVPRGELARASAVHKPTD